MTDIRKITSGMIYDEAHEARLTIQEVLDLLNSPSEDEDPIQNLVKLLSKIAVMQSEVLKRLDGIERRLGSQ